MKKQRILKQNIVEKITENYNSSKSILIWDYKGIKTFDLINIKESLLKQNCLTKIYKNTLVLVALKNLGLKIEKKHIDGQNVIVFSKEEELAPFKIINNFRRKFRGIKLKLAIIENKIIFEKDIISLTKYESKSMMYVSLIQLLQSNIVKLVLTLTLLKDKLNSDLEKTKQ